MSQQDRQIAEYIAHTVVDRLLQAAQDKENAGKILDVWGGEIDRTIGRGLRRLGFYVMLAMLGIAASKFGLWSKLFP